MDETGSQWARALMLVANSGVNMKQRHVRLAGKETHKLPAGSALTVLGIVVKPIGLFQILVQPSDPESGRLPRGVQTLCSVVRTDQSCVQGGVITVEILNLNEEDVWLQPRSVLGELDVVDVLQPLLTTQKRDSMR